MSKDTNRNNVIHYENTPHINTKVTGYETGHIIVYNTLIVHSLTAGPPSSLSLSISLSVMISRRMYMSGSSYTTSALTGWMIK